MRDLNWAFNEFYQKLTLNTVQRRMLRELRHAVHTCIRRYFQNKLRLHPPELLKRGRFARRTLAAPPQGELVFEEDVLLKHLDKKDPGTWPSSEIAHLIMINALQGLTLNPPFDRKYSICVRYPGLYQIDFYVLAQSQNGWMLAINGARGWSPYHHRLLSDWFEKQIQHYGLQLHRIACYLNAWADHPLHQLEHIARALPLDILVAQFFCPDIGRDDAAFAKTAAAIAAGIGPGVIWSSPLSNKEDLSWLLSQQDKEGFLKTIQALAHNAALAVKTSNVAEACAIWRGLLGDRFPVVGNTPLG